MRCPWDDEQRRALLLERASQRARYRGFGAAFDREVPGDRDEAFFVVFIVSDGREWIDALVLFPGAEGLRDRIALTDSQWILERAVENELLARASRRSAGLRSLFEAGGYLVIVDRVFR